MKLVAALKRLASDLRQLDCPFAIVGGLAASVHGEARFTRDIDVALALETDEEAEKLLFALKSRGYIVAEVFEELTL